MHASINVMPGLTPGIHAFRYAVKSHGTGQVPLGWARSALAMHRADLVAERIAQIGEIDPSGRALAPAGRILDALAAVGDAGVVKGLHLLRTRARKTDRAAIGMASGSAIDRLGDAERTGLGAV